MVQVSDLQVSDADYFQASEFSPEEVSRVFHGFFGRQGGVSRDVYASLNCGRGSADEPDHVVQNIARVEGLSGVKRGALLTLHQIHSKECVVVEKPWALQDRPKADAFVTKIPGIALGILTADCGPVLFSGRDADGAPVIGAAHAGWGGAFGGVLEETVAKMIELGAQKDTIEAAIGPCIGQESYEVGAEFVERFIEADPANERFFIPSKRDGFMMFDLPGYCKQRLENAGVRKVCVKGLDTYFNEEDFFSYRRATHRSEPDYGRQVSVIAIRETA